MGILHKYIHAKMANGAEWKVPIDMVALNKSRAHMNNFSGNSISRIITAIDEITEEFDKNPEKAMEWASEMTWKEVQSFAIPLNTVIISLEECEGYWGVCHKEIID